MMSWDSLVIGDRLDVQQKPVLGVPLIHVDMSWSRAVCRAIRVVSRDCIRGTCCFHGDDRKFVFGKTSKQLWKFGLHFVHIVRVQVKQLRAGCGVETTLVLDVVVQAGEVLETKLV